MNNSTIDKMYPVAEHSGLESYIETALWSTTGDDCQPLDRSGLRLSAVAREELNLAVIGFWQLIAENGLTDHPEVVGGNIEHDLWLTRNGHGAGFWDGDYPETGDRLTAMAEGFGECELYVSDDQEIEIY
jgi:hypothetical protein